MPIPGTTKLARLEENIGAADIRLTRTDLAAIEDAASRIEIAGERYAPTQLAMVGRDAPRQRAAPDPASRAERGLLKDARNSR